MSFKKVMPYILGWVIVFILIWVGSNTYIW